VLLRLFYLSVTGVFGLLRLLPVSDRDKDAEIVVLRHQIAVRQRQLGTTRPRFSPGDRAFLAALLHWLPRGLLGRILLVRPDTVLRWHRDLLARRHAARSRPGRLPEGQRRRLFFDLNLKRTGPEAMRRQILASARPRSIRGLAVVAVAALATITTIVGAVAALVNRNKLGDIVGVAWRRSSSRSPWSAA